MNLRTEIRSGLRKTHSDVQYSCPWIRRFRIPECAKLPNYSEKSI